LKIKVISKVRKVRIKLKVKEEEIIKKVKDIIRLMNLKKKNKKKKWLKV
jgi:energy-coupling factor transporter ATP-binding protein EcfA2